MTLTAADILGAWQLVRFVVAFDDGRPEVFPFGPDATGRLLYSADGSMLAVLSSANRPPFDVPRLEAASLASPTDKAAAFDTYLSYGGRWSLEGNTVTHHVEVALLPNLVGAEQVREAQLVDGQLHLTYRVEPRRGCGRDYTLVWRRLRALRSITAPRPALYPPEPP